MITNLARYRAEKKGYIIKDCWICNNEENLKLKCENCNGNGFIECICETHPDFKLGN